MIRILFILILNYINFVNNFNVNKCCDEKCYHNGMFIKEHCCSIAEYTVLENDTVQLTCQPCNDSDYNKYINWRFQSQNSIKFDVKNHFHSSTVTFRGSDIPNDRTGSIKCFTAGDTDKTVHFEYFVCSKLKKPGLQCVIGPENYSNWLQLSCKLKIDTSEYKNVNRCRYNFNISDIIDRAQGAHQVTQSCFSNCTWVNIRFRNRSWFDGGTSIMQISATSDVEKTKHFNLTIPEYQKIYVQNDKPIFINCTNTTCSFEIRTLPDRLSQNYSSFDYNITIFDEKSTEQKRFYKANNSVLIIDTLKPFKNYTIQMMYKLSAAINEREYHSQLFTFSNCTTLPSVPSVVKLTNGSFIVNDTEVVVIWKPINSDDYGAPGFQYTILVENETFNTRDSFYKFDFAKDCKMQNECSIRIGARNDVGGGMFQSLKLSFNLPAPKNVMAINPPDEDRFRLEWTPVESSAYYVAFWCNVSSRKRSWEMCNESLTWETIHGNQTWLENVGISKMNIFGVSACSDDHKCSGIRTAREFSSSFSDFDKIPTSTWVLTLGIVVIIVCCICAVVWMVLNRVKVKKSRQKLSKLIDDERNAHRAGVQDWINNSQRDADMKKYVKKLIGVESLTNLTFTPDECFHKPKIQRSKSSDTVHSELVPPEVPNSPIPKLFPKNKFQDFSDADDSEPTSINVNPYQQDFAADDLHRDILHRETTENLDLLPNECDEKTYSPTHLKLPETYIFVKDKLYSDSKVADYDEQPYVYYQETHFDRGK